jgi:hypothetical protein
MKPFLACVTLVLSTVPASAHFIWLIAPESRDAQGPVMVFSDSPTPDENVAVSKIAKTKLFALAGKGDMVQVKTVEDKKAYKISHSGEGLVMIAGTCTYGVVSKGKSKPFLLIYHPKTVLRKGFVREKATWVFSPSSRLPLEFVPLEKKTAYKVYWHGKSAANIEVVLLAPGVAKPVESKTDADGEVAVPEPKSGGVYGMRARFVEAKAGELDGKRYEEVRHYATFTFHVPERFLKKNQ